MGNPESACVICNRHVKHCQAKGVHLYTISSGSSGRYPTAMTTRILLENHRSYELLKIRDFRIPLPRWWRLD